MTPATLVKAETYRPSFWVLPDRRLTMAYAAIAGVIFIAILTAILPPG